MASSLSSSNARKYGSKNPLKRLLLARFLNRLFLNIQKSHPTSVLDVGCGEGFIAKQLLQAIEGVKYVGVDTSESALAEAREMNPGEQFLISPAEKLPFADDEFDMVICVEVLEHLQEPADAVQEICRVARRSVVFSVPHEPFFQLGNLLGLSHLATLGNPPDHLNHWNTSQFRAFVGPFVAVDHTETPFPWQLLIAKPRAVPHAEDAS